MLARCEVFNPQNGTVPGLSVTVNQSSNALPGECGFAYPHFFSSLFLLARVSKCCLMRCGIVDDDDQHVGLFAGSILFVCATSSYLKISAILPWFLVKDVASRMLIRSSNGTEHFTTFKSDDWLGRGLGKGELGIE